MNIEKIKTFSCPVEAAMGVIGGKYKALIVYELINGTPRYHEIQKAVPTRVQPENYLYDEGICWKKKGQSNLWQLVHFMKRKQMCSIS